MNNNNNGGNANLLIGNEIATLADRGVLGEFGNLLRPWINARLRESLQARFARTEFTSKAGKADNDGKAATTFSGKSVKETVDYPYTLKRLGEFIIATERSLAGKEFNVLHKMEGVPCPKPCAEWLRDNTVTALSFMAGLDVKTEAGQLAKKQAANLLAEIAAGTRDGRTLQEITGALVPA